MSPSVRTTPLSYLTLSVLILLLLMSPHELFAENAREQYKKIQKDLERQKEKLEQTKRQEHSVLGDLDNVTKRLVAVEADLKRQQRRLRHTDDEIRKVEAEIAATRSELDKKKRWMKRRLRAMHRYGEAGDLFFLLTASDDMASLMRRWKYLETITVSERRVTEEYASTLRSLGTKEKHLLDLRATLKREEERIRLTEASVLEKRKEKESLLASIRKEKSSHEKLLRELQDASKRLLEVLRKLDEKDTYEAKGFTALKGTLSWPVNGKVAIPYGSQRDQEFNTPVFRNGIHIRTDEDTVRTVYSGKVVFSDWFKGYGNLVIVNHGEGYHTLYGNLSETFLKVGDIISTKDAIGKVGESGLLNAPSLYFEVRYKGKPLDPMQWLKRK